MELVAALAFVRGRRHGVLATVRANGRPQLTNIVYACRPDDVVEISVTGDRAKTKNLRRDPRASLYVVGDDFWSYVVLEGEATLSAVAADPADPVVDDLVAMYRTVSGEHPDWEDYRRAMVADRRLLVRLRFERAYGVLRS
jgi:PPOX class probable F420-dependent enzyme